MTTFQHLQPYYDLGTFAQPTFHQYYSTEFRGLEVAVNPSNLIETVKINEKYDAKSSKRSIVNRLVTKADPAPILTQPQNEGQKPIISGLLHNNEYYPRFKFRPLSNIIGALAFDMTNENIVENRTQAVATTKFIASKNYPLDIKSRMIEISNKLEADEAAQRGYRELDLTLEHPPGLNLAISMQENQKAIANKPDISKQIFEGMAPKQMNDLTNETKIIRDKGEKTITKLNRDEKRITDALYDIQKQRTVKAGLVNQNQKHQDQNTVVRELQVREINSTNKASLKEKSAKHRI